MFGFGPSGPQVSEGWYGVPYAKPWGRTREYIEVVREIIARSGPLEHQGQHYQLPMPGGTGQGKALKLNFHPLRNEIPVFVGAIGRKSVEMAAEICDGWIPIFFSPDAFEETWGEHLEAGFAKGGRTRSDLEVSPSIQVAIDGDLEVARNVVRTGLLLYLGGMGSRETNFYVDLACRFGFEEEALRGAVAVPRRQARRGLQGDPGRALRRDVAGRHRGGGHRAHRAVHRRRDRPADLLAGPPRRRPADAHDRAAGRDRRCTGASPEVVTTAAIERGAGYNEPMPDLNPGTTFAGHRIEGIAGRGGMGTVYRATHIALDHVVALKVISPRTWPPTTPSASGSARSRGSPSRSATRTSSRSTTPGEEDGLLFVTMDLVDGPDLRKMLVADGTLPPDRAIGIIEQVASALDVAHSRGLVHRDIKPGNILVERDSGRPRVPDRLRPREAVRSGDRGGRPDPYRRLRRHARLRRARADPRRPGRRPHRRLRARLRDVRGDGRPGAVRRPRGERRQDLRPSPGRAAMAAGRGGDGGSLDEVIARALAKEPGDRYPSAGDLARAAAAAVEGGQVLHSAERSVATGKAAPETDEPTAPPMPPVADTVESEARRWRSRLPPSRPTEPRRPPSRAPEPPTKPRPSSPAGRAPPKRAAPAAARAGAASASPWLRSPW